MSEKSTHFVLGSENPIIRRLSIVLMLLVSGIIHAERMERVFYLYDASNGLADNSAQTIMCTKTGRMVITTIGHVNFYDGANFVHIDPTAENDFPLPKYSRNQFYVSCYKYYSPPQGAFFYYDNKSIILYRYILYF